MAALCCCFHIRDPEEDVSTPQNCLCPNCILHTLLVKYTAIFSNEQLNAPTSTVQMAAPSNSDAASNNTNSDTATSPPRTLHFDTDAATCSGQEQDGQITEDENNQVIDMEHASEGNKSAELQCNGRSTECCSESQFKLSFEKYEAKVAYACELSEDEDVCPTCLEEYIPDNPRIVLQCSHSYHLGCIYEWMERSENCPICDKVMVFDEAD